MFQGLKGIDLELLFTFFSPETIHFDGCKNFILPLDTSALFEFAMKGDRLYKPEGTDTVYLDRIGVISTSPPPSSLTAIPLLNHPLELFTVSHKINTGNRKIRKSSL